MRMAPPSPACLHGPARAGAAAGCSDLGLARGRVSTPSHLKLLIGDVPAARMSMGLALLMAEWVVDVLDGR